RRDEERMGERGPPPPYRAEFRPVFGRDFDPAGVAQAIAAYVRTILSGDSPYDRFQAGDTSAMSESAQRGLTLFEGKAMCSRCHAGFNFTGENYRNIGVGMAGKGPHPRPVSPPPTRSGPAPLHTPTPPALAHP